MFVIYSKTQVSLPHFLPYLSVFPHSNFLASCIHLFKFYLSIILYSPQTSATSKNTYVHTHTLTYTHTHVHINSLLQPLAWQSVAVWCSDCVLGSGHDVPEFEPNSGNFHHPHTHAHTHTHTRTPSPAINRVMCLSGNDIDGQVVPLAVLHHTAQGGRILETVLIHFHCQLD